MSSVYKKGRDGYYYYQTYLYNDSTGKKDKKIFHSLGTKNFDEAKLKQSVLDEKYRTLARKKSFSIFPFSSKKYFLSTFVFILTFIIIFKIQDRSKNKVEKTKAIIENPKENIPLEENLDEKILKENSLPKNYEKIASREDDSLAKNTGEEYLINEWNLNYTLQRIDQMSGSFDQIKLFATIEKKLNSNQLLELCQNIADDYSDFSNIIICVYLGNQIGIELAKGKIKNINTDQQIESWLAMYTYNPVEGIYFDDRPGKYFGGS